MSALDNQVGGDHYKKLGQFQPWSVLAKWMTPEELRGFMKGTVIVYLAREGDKGGDQDIEKALHTMQLYLEVVATQAKPDETPLPESVVFKPGPVERVEEWEPGTPIGSIHFYKGEAPTLEEIERMKRG